jgi:hypothetical protein
MFETLIASSTVGSGGASSITFSSIPATFTDLTLVLSARATSTTATITVAFNGSVNDFYGLYMQGNGSTASTTNQTTFIGNAPISTNTASTFGNLRIFIPNYAGSAQKAFSVDAVTETNATTAFVQLFATTWQNTAAINQITLSLANFAEFSTAYLYGTLKGSGGGTIS